MSKKNEPKGYTTEELMENTNKLMNDPQAQKQWARELEDRGMSVSFNGPIPSIFCKDIHVAGGTPIMAHIKPGDQTKEANNFWDEVKHELKNSYKISPRKAAKLVKDARKNFDDAPELLWCLQHSGAEAIAEDILEGLENEARNKSD